MSEISQHDFSAAALHQELLSTPFGVQTNWHVITGAPCSGKTTLIDQLAEQGFQTVPEVGRQYIEEEMAKGRTIDEIRENQADVALRLMDITLRIENGLRAHEVLFLDRAFPDALAFCRVNGLDPNEFLGECFRHHYASVFVLDRLPVEQDGVRTEDDVCASLIDKWLASDYRALGYSVVRVPVLAPEERVAFVLETLSEQGLM
jgi:predicted ATPase